jgi:carbon monoxide dehydrogenase subunit G
MRLERTVSTDKPVDRVFAYLADFTTTTEWDPGTVRTTRTSGDGGVGTVYHNVSRFAGRETELDYTVVERVENQRVALEGRNRSVTAHDLMTFREVDGGTEVTYVADFDFGLLTPVIGLVMRPFFTKLGDEAQEGMTAALARL